jgi:hypothetical protein
LLSGLSAADKRIFLQALQRLSREPG